MPTTLENSAIWDGRYDWSHAGEAWSEAWGGSEAQWYGTLLPRIHRFLPAGTILELAPGYGRWSRYLREHCEQLVLVDLSERCIEACRVRFADDPGVTCFVNDGSSLPMMEDGSIDFVFSFDALVHVEADVLDAYLRELSRKLKPDGAGFLHHSNAGRYRRYFDTMQRIRPKRLRHFLVESHFVDHDEWRGLTMTAERFAASCTAAGLECVAQELVNWNTRRLIDSLSTIAKPGSRWSRPRQVLETGRFMAEARDIRRRAPLYASPLEPDGPPNA